MLERPSSERATDWQMLTVGKSNKKHWKFLHFRIIWYLYSRMRVSTLSIDAWRIYSKVHQKIIYMLKNWQISVQLRFVYPLFVDFFVASRQKEQMMACESNRAVEFTIEFHIVNSGYFDQVHKLHCKRELFAREYVFLFPQYYTTSLTVYIYHEIAPKQL